MHSQPGYDFLLSNSTDSNLPGSGKATPAASSATALQMILDTLKGLVTEPQRYGGPLPTLRELVLVVSVEITAETNVAIISYRETRRGWPERVDGLPATVRDSVAASFAKWTGPNEIPIVSIGSPTPIADAQAGDRGRSPKGRVGRRGRTTSPRGKPTFLSTWLDETLARR